MLLTPGEVKKERKKERIAKDIIIIIAISLHCYDTTYEQLLLGRRSTLTHDIIYVKLETN